MFDLKFQQFDAMRVKAQKLTREVREKLYVNAGRAGARVIRERARNNAKRLDDPETAEQIFQNVTAFRRKRGVAQGDVKFSVGVMGGARQYANTKENVRKRRVGQTYLVGGQTWYWRFLELGNENQQATPFLRPAAFTGSEEIMDAIATNLDRGLDRETKKL